jgi:hypothetical protein
LPSPSGPAPLSVLFRRVLRYETIEVSFKHLVESPAALLSLIQPKFWFGFK